MLKFQLVFRSGTKAVSVVLVIRKQCVWIATHMTGKQCECSYTLTFPAVCLLRALPPNPFLNTEFHSVATRSANAFLSAHGAPFRSIGGRESLTPFANMICPKIGLPLESGMAKCHPGFLLSATVAMVATVLGVPLKTPSRPLRASRFTRLLQTRVLPPPCRSAGYAVRCAWFCSRTSPDVLPIGGWHSHSDAW